jgi:hypothetical protein
LDSTSIFLIFFVLSFVAGSFCPNIHCEKP